MHDKHKNFSSNSTIGVKNPIAEHSKIKDKRSNTQENTQTINDLVDDTEPNEHKKSFVNQKLFRKVNYIGRNIEEPTNIDDSNKEGLYFKKIENYTPLGENILSKKASPFEPNYVIEPDFDIGDEVHDPYKLKNIKSPLCTIHYSKETNEFREMVQDDKSLSMVA